MKRLFSIPLWMAVLAALSLAACTPKEPEVVEITLTDFGVESSVTTFKVGQPYEFVITNTGALNHEFVIMRPLEEDEIEAPADEHGAGGHSMDDALLTIAEDDLPPGAVVTANYTFRRAADTGELELACHIAGHYTAGMHIPITVERQ